MSLSKGTTSAGKCALGVGRLALGLLEDFSDGLPLPVKGAIKAVLRIINLTEAVQTNREDFQTLQGRVSDLTLLVVKCAKNVSQSSRDDDIPEELAHRLNALEETLKAVAEDLKHLKVSADPKKVSAYFRAIVSSDDHIVIIKNCNQKLEWAMKVFQVNSHINDATLLHNLMQEVEALKMAFETYMNTGRLEELPRAKQADYQFKPQRCLEGTRVQLLEDIYTWVEKTEIDVPPVYWLNGMAGTGKSTISRTVAETTALKRILGASIFFSRSGESELSDPSLVMSTIAYQLAGFNREFKHYLALALVKDPNLPYAPISHQLQRMIINPLRNAISDPDRIVVIVLDAVDECSNANVSSGAKKILQLLVTAIPQFQFHLKLFVASRPEAHIRSILQPSPHVATVKLHEIEQSIVEDDIRLFIKTALTEIPDILDLPLPEDWITAQDIEALTKQAGKLFVFASTAVLFIGDDICCAPRSRLQLILHSESPSGVHSFWELDQLYTTILKDAAPKRFNSKADSDQFFVRFQDVVGMVILLREQLPITVMARLARRLEEDIHSALRHLHSVISTPRVDDAQGYPQVQHPSFPDFMCNRERCVDARFVLDVRERHAQLALWCFERLEDQLKKNLIGQLDPAVLNRDVPELEIRLDQALPSEAKYATRHWAHHLSAASTQNSVLLAALEVFMSTRVIWWLEAMSLLGEVRFASISIIKATEWVKAASVTSPAGALLYDIYRLLLAHSTTIAQSSAQLYRSILPFLPRDTPLAKCYVGQGDAVVHLVGGWDHAWPDCLALLPGHNRAVNGIEFSPDDARIVSWSYDGTVIVWDSATATAIFRLVDPHSAVVGAVFSSDGAKLTTLSTEASCVWDMAIGSQIKITKLGIIDLPRRAVPPSIFCQTTRFVLSPNGSMVAKAYNYMLVVWDTASGKPIFNAEVDTRFPRHTLTFSSDSTKLVAKSFLGQVIIWETGSWSKLADYDASVIAYSSDGTKLAGESEPGEISIWDATTGSSLCTIKLDGNRDVWAAFSQDGSRLGAGSSSGIEIWDVAKGARLFSMGNGGRNSIIFSPDGSTIAKLDSNVMSLREMSTGAHIAELRGHGDTVGVVAYSRDGTKIASGSERGVVGIWSAVTNSLIQANTLEDEISSVAFSTDKERAVSGSNSGAVRVWNVTSGSLAHEWKDHTYAVTSTTFSPDDTKVASGSCEPRVIVWDLLTGSRIIDLQNNAIATFSMDGPKLAFSHDGTKLALASGPGARIWDLATAKSIFRYHDPGQAIEGHFPPSDAFSDSLLRSEGEFFTVKTVRHYDKIRCLAFSPNGQQLATAWIDNKEIRISDVVNSRLIGLFSGHNTEALTYSLDGTKLLSRGTTGDYYLADLVKGTFNRQSKDIGRDFFSTNDSLYTFFFKGYSLYATPVSGSPVLCCTVPASFMVLAETLFWHGNYVVFIRRGGRLVFLTLSL